MSDFVDRVRELAYIGHDGQYRPGSGLVPYIEHPKAVVETLYRWGVTRDLVIATAWAHDLLEVTDVTEEDLENVDANYGAALAQWVKCLTYDPFKWNSKAEWLEHMKSNVPLPVLGVKVADRYCNACDCCNAGRWTKARSYLREGLPVIACVEEWSTTIREDFDQLWNKIWQECKREALLQQSQKKSGYK